MSEKVYSHDELKTLIAPVAQRFGIDRIYLFGSYARGEARNDSDVDIRIDGGSIRSFLTLGNLYNAMEDALQKSVDIITGGDADEEFLSAISAEEVLIYAT